MSREGPDVEEEAAVAAGQEPERVLVAAPMILEIPGLPAGQAAGPNACTSRVIWSTSGGGVSSAGRGQSAMRGYDNAAARLAPRLRARWRWGRHRRGRRR